MLENNLLLWTGLIVLVVWQIEDIDQHSPRGRAPVEEFGARNMPQPHLQRDGQVVPKDGWIVRVFATDSGRFHSNAIEPVVECSTSGES